MYKKLFQLTIFITKQNNSEKVAEGVIVEKTAMRMIEVDQRVSANIWLITKIKIEVWMDELYQLGTHSK